MGRLTKRKVISIVGRVPCDGPPCFCPDLESYCRKDWFSSDRICPSSNIQGELSAKVASASPSTLVLEKTSHRGYWVGRSKTVRKPLLLYLIVAIKTTTYKLDSHLASRQSPSSSSDDILHLQLPLKDDSIVFVKMTDVTDYMKW
jgi:hypothetical protein